MAERIPDNWKKAVTAILDKGLERVKITLRAQQNFEELFPDTFNYNLIEVFADALRIPDLSGNKIEGMSPKGETYEFIFEYRRKLVYGKVCLREDGKLVVIFSAHRPLKGNAL